MLELTGKQRRHLRSLGHHLEPALMVGASGVTDGVARELTESLAVHELVKVRLGQACGVGRKEVARLLADATGAAIAQVLGRTILLYRPAKQPRIQLP